MAIHPKRNSDDTCAKPASPLVSLQRCSQDGDVEVASFHDDDGEDALQSCKHQEGHVGAEGLGNGSGVEQAEGRRDSDVVMARAAVDRLRVKYDPAQQRVSLVSFLSSVKTRRCRHILGTHHDRASRCSFK